MPKLSQNQMWPQDWLLSVFVLVCHSKVYKAKRICVNGKKPAWQECKSRLGEQVQVNQPNSFKKYMSCLFVCIAKLDLKWYTQLE